MYKLNDASFSSFKVFGSSTSLWLRYYKDSLTYIKKLSYTFSRYQILLRIVKKKWSFFHKDFFRKYDQICSFLQIW